MAEIGRKGDGGYMAFVIFQIRRPADAKEMRAGPQPPGAIDRLEPREYRTVRVDQSGHGPP